MNPGTVVTWNTHKTAAGYQFKVYTVGYQVPTVVLKEGVMSSRARAKTRAQAWVRYYKGGKNV